MLVSVVCIFVNCINYCYEIWESLACGRFQDAAILPPTAVSDKLLCPGNLCKPSTPMTESIYQCLIKSNLLQAGEEYIQVISINDVIIGEIIRLLHFKVMRLMAQGRQRPPSLRVSGYFEINRQLIPIVCRFTLHSFACT